MVKERAERGFLNPLLAYGVPGLLLLDTSTCAYSWKKLGANLTNLSQLYSDTWCHIIPAGYEPQL